MQLIERFNESEEYAVKVKDVVKDPNDPNLAIELICDDPKKDDPDVKDFKNIFKDSFNNQDDKLYLESIDDKNKTIIFNLLFGMRVMRSKGIQIVNLDLSKDLLIKWAEREPLFILSGTLFDRTPVVNSSS